MHQTRCTIMPLLTHLVLLYVIRHHVYLIWV